MLAHDADFGLSATVTLPVPRMTVSILPVVVRWLTHSLLPVPKGCPRSACMDRRECAKVRSDVLCCEK